MFFPLPLQLIVHLFLSNYKTGSIPFDILYINAKFAYITTQYPLLLLTYVPLWSLQTYTPLVFLIFFNLTLIIIQCYSLFSIFLVLIFSMLKYSAFMFVTPPTWWLFLLYLINFTFFCINTSVLTYSCEKKNIHTGQSKPLIILCRKKIDMVFRSINFCSFFSFYSCSYSLFTWFFEHTYYNVPGPTWESVQDFLISLAMKS